MLYYVIAMESFLYANRPERLQGVSTWMLYQSSVYYYNTNDGWYLHTRKEVTKIGSEPENSDPFVKMLGYVEQWRRDKEMAKRDSAISLEIQRREEKTIGNKSP